jgi:hypothetical protein
VTQSAAATSLLSATTLHTLSTAVTAIAAGTALSLTGATGAVLDGAASSLYATGANLVLASQLGDVALSSAVNLAVGAVGTGTLRSEGVMTVRSGTDELALLSPTKLQAAAPWVDLAGGSSLTAEAPTLVALSSATLLSLQSAQHAAVHSDAAVTIASEGGVSVSGGNAVLITSPWTVSLAGAQGLRADTAGSAMTAAGALYGVEAGTGISMHAAAGDVSFIAGGGGVSDFSQGSTLRSCA